jgi:phytoene/squalene synthetase
MMELFDKVSERCSRLATHVYSTSFSLGIRCLHKRLRNPIYAIYGFVRFADEIVDSFHDFDKEDLLKRFKAETYRAIDEKISLNPILHNFQIAANRYGIEKNLLGLFLQSMENDLHKKNYNEAEIKEYIIGSAEVVGLMCLRVFCEGNDLLYHKLSGYARSLGSAFQKVNFMRDIHADYNGLGRVYFPGVNMNQWNTNRKKEIEKSIDNDFVDALKGIKQLPRASRLGVYLAYVYYLTLFKKIKNTPAELVFERRIRIANSGKAGLLAYSYVKHQLNLI